MTTSARHDIVHTPLVRHTLPHNVDRKARAAGAEIGNVSRLAWERSLAHFEAPGEFPLPADPSCQERCFWEAGADLPSGVRRRRARDAAKLLRSSVAQRRAVLGNAADLDPRSTVSSIDQARGRPVPLALQFTFADLDEVAAAEVAGADPRRTAPTRRRGGPIASPRAAAPGGVAPIDRVKLVATSLRCVEDSLEPGRDEIVLGGFFATAGFDLTNGDLVTPPIVPSSGVFDVADLGKYRKQERRSLDNLVIENLFLGSLATERAVPLMPLATVFLGEKDLFGFGLKMEALSKGFQIAIIGPLIATYFVQAAVANLSMMGLFTTLSIVVQSAWIVGITAAVAGVLRLLGDELFNANQLSLLVDSPQFRFPDGDLIGETTTLTYRRLRAHYELDVHWELVLAD